ncbi:MAG: RNA 2'-phosphotransferase [Hyphomicrobiales bacterium]|nr:RNA 2'-phosphotransferase [Hyphomicrobiales bacterium]MCP5000221.1 RNA 2'-phosphotransferase [Hyphomicrobiales bacterium]
MENSHTKTSKFLSYVLRHKPEAIGLELDAEGWASVEELIDRADMSLSRALIEDVVATSDKKRFALSGDGLFIRANQGHSIEVDLGLEAIEPPQKLYHGTATRFLGSILRQGLQPQNRQYVHLSGDEEIATLVGKRHGNPAILVIPARQMHFDGHRFFQAKNGVWLVA